jgi:hypothetical protein
MSTHGAPGAPGSVWIQQILDTCRET